MQQLHLIVILMKTCPSKESRELFHSDEAIFELMEEKSYNKITIDDIIARAGVSRATWFRKFNTKEEAICFIMNKKWNDWLIKKDITDYTKINFTDANFSFNFFLEHKKYCVKMHKAGLQHLFIKNFIYFQYT